MLKKNFLFLLLILVAVFYVGPFLWMVTTSLKTTSEAAATPPIWLPLGYNAPLKDAAPGTAGVPPAEEGGTAQHSERVPDYAELADRHISPTDSPILQRFLITKYNYQTVLTDPAFDFLLYARNTLIIALLVVLGSVFSASLVAYSLAKLRWYGRNLLFGIILATMMLPFTVFMIPHYFIYKSFHLIGTNVPLWLGSFCGPAFFIFLFRQFYMTIPDELLDAARIDGCSELRIWAQIILPLSKPAMAVVALFAFMGAWNDFLGPLVFLTHRQNFTLSLALQFFQSRAGGTVWELLMAASLLVIAPILAIFFLAQKTFIQGIATTGMKG